MIIISYGLWQRRYGASPAAIGASLAFEGKSYRVAGVTPASFRFFGDADVFTPLGQNTARSMQNREAHPGIQVVARLRPGWTIEEARAELALIGHQLSDKSDSR